MLTYRRWRKVLSCWPCCALLAAPPADALQAVLVGSGYTQPLLVTAPIGDSRIFVVEKGGLIRVQDGSTVSTFLDLRPLVDSSGERGLLGLAFDPAYASNGRFYVDYIDATTRNTVVAAYTAVSPAASVADPGSARLVLTVPQPAGQSNHKAGWIGFSPADPGRLYIATGDGGRPPGRSGTAGIRWRSVPHRHAAAFLQAHQRWAASSRGSGTRPSSRCSGASSAWPARRRRRRHGAALEALARSCAEALPWPGAMRSP
jgi:glucose/arabinose dehydrogenase